MAKEISNKIKFKQIEKIAKKHFCVWEGDYDFIWFRGEWEQLSSYIESKQEAINFILGLSSIYDEFCKEAFCVGDEDNSLLNSLKLSHRDLAINVLHNTYLWPEEVMREFTRITIDFTLPNVDGYIFIDKLFEGRLPIVTFSPYPTDAF